MDIFDKQLPEHITRRQTFTIRGVRKKAFRQLELVAVGTLKHQGNAFVYRVKDVEAAIKRQSNA
jgi:Flp pilus assembly CpaF family ATPase